MSDTKKLLGGKETEIGKLKALWRSLAEPSRDYWREQFISKRSQAEIRGEIFTKLKINLQYDKQLNRFRDWLKDQEKRDAQAERMVENEHRLTEQHPEWSIDRIREEVLKQSYFETLATGDFKLGLKTVKADQNERVIGLDREKFEFDAAKACLAKLPELKTISSSKTLSEPQKVEQIRLKLFGVTP